MNCTTAQFDGVIAMIRPEESWVVRLLTPTTLPSTLTDPLDRCNRQNGSVTVRDSPFRLAGATALSDLSSPSSRHNIR